MASNQFSQKLGFAQYQTANSPIKHIDPRVRIICLILLMVTFLSIDRLNMLLVGLLGMMLGYRIMGLPRKQLLQTILRALPLLLFLGFFQLFRFSSSLMNPLLFQLWRWQITVDGVQAAIIVAMRFLVLILLINLAGISLSTSELVYGLRSLLRPLRFMNHAIDDLVMVVQITLRFFPILTETVEQITKAQTARGADWNSREKNILKRLKHMYPVLVPMFMISLQKAEYLALAMDARAYGTNPNRGAYYEFKMRWQDWMILAGSILLCSLMIGL